MIDCHVHLYPQEVISAPLTWGHAYKEKLWSQMVAPRKNGTPSQGWVNSTQLLADMDAAGVGRVLLLGWYWENHSTCTINNRWHAHWIHEHPERLSAFATVQPLAGEKALEDLKRAIDAGMCGIGEIFPAAQGFTKDNPTWLKILAWAEENALPVNLHVTDPVGRFYPGRTESPLVDYLWIAQQFPNLKIILAHWGGGLVFYEWNRFCQKAFANVYYDTSASPLMYKAGIFKTAIDTVGADKILFGSDYPLILYPKKQKKPDFSLFIDEIKNLGLENESWEKITYKNAKKLFSL